MLQLGKRNVFFSNEATSLCWELPQNLETWMVTQRFNNLKAKIILFETTLIVNVTTVKQTWTRNVFVWTVISRCIAILWHQASCHQLLCCHQWLQARCHQLLHCHYCNQANCCSITRLRSCFIAVSCSITRSCFTVISCCISRSCFIVVSCCIFISGFKFFQRFGCVNLVHVAFLRQHLCEDRKWCECCLR